MQRIRGSTAKWIAITILVLSAGWIWLSRVPENAVNAGNTPAPRTGFLSPDFELAMMSGETVRLSDLRGQPLLINFWASWCTPCRVEMPAMQRAFQEYKDQGFTILAINATHQDSLEKARSLTESLGLDFPVLMDETGSVSSRYETLALPTSFFVDRDGIIREVVIGGPMSEALLRIRIEQLLRDNTVEDP
jgi:peroxiredoxin